MTLSVLLESDARLRICNLGGAEVTTMRLLGNSPMKLERVVVRAAGETHSDQLSMSSPCSVASLRTVIVEGPKLKSLDVVLSSPSLAA